jgi:hypothetical protein
MGAPGEHRAYPWPPAARRATWRLLWIVVVALGTAAAPAIGALFGQSFPSDAMQGWLALWVPLAVAGLGGAFGVLAWGILAVNQGRGGGDDPYLLPARAAVIETRFRAIFVVYVVAAAALAVALAGLGALLVARALGVI